MNAKPLLVAFSCAARSHQLARARRPAPRKPPRGNVDAALCVYTVRTSTRAVRPQDDFYRFVNGQWLTNTTIPSDRSNYGAFALLEDGAENDLKAILLKQPRQPTHRRGSDVQKVGDLYASFLDETDDRSARARAARRGELQAHRRARRPSRTWRATSATASASSGDASVRVLRVDRSEELQPVHRHHRAERPGHAGSRLLPIQRRAPEGAFARNIRST